MACENHVVCFSSALTHISANLVRHFLVEGLGAVEEAGMCGQVTVFTAAEPQVGVDDVVNFESAAADGDDEDGLISCCAVDGLNDGACHGLDGARSRCCNK